MNELNPIDSLHIFDSSDNQKSVFANVTYIVDRETNSVLLLRQTKTTRVTEDFYVGIGGKMLAKALDNEASEKNLTRDLVDAAAYGYLKIEDFEKGSVREIYEETGLTVHETDLINIGVSHVRLLSKNKDEVWNISYNICDKFTGNIKECDEGVLEWVDIANIANIPMRLADKITLKKALSNNKESFFMEAIYENDGGKLRYESKTKVDENNYGFVCVLIPNLKEQANFIRQRAIANITKMETHYRKIIDILPAHTLSYLPGVEYNVLDLYKTIEQKGLPKGA